MNQQKNLHPLIHATIRQLQEYVKGERRAFDLPLDLGGTPFQQAVWKETMRIPKGETRTYAEIAKAIGKPKAVRAVGTALKMNPICILVPCHRVVPSGGGIGNYAGGKGKKEWLLACEQMA